MSDSEDSAFGFDLTTKGDSKKSDDLSNELAIVDAYNSISLKPKFKTDEFPSEYRFLLNLPVINDVELKKHSKLYSLVFNEQKSPKKIIEKEVAIICLNWAQSILECEQPLLEDAKLLFDRSFSPNSKTNSRIACIVFKVECGPKNDDEANKRTPKKGMIILFQTKDGEKILAKVDKPGKDCWYFAVRFAARNANQYYALVGQIVDIYEVPQDFVPVSMMRSIEELRSGFLNQILVPEPTFDETYLKYNKRKSEQMDEFLVKYDVSTSLTDSQKDALFAICHKEHKDWPFVVWGPPGTGKTHTISATVQTLLKMEDSNRILVCTPSNMASDHVAGQLMKEFGNVLNQNNVLRLRSVGNDYSLRDTKFDPIISCDPDCEVYTIPEFFDQWRVVICTLGASAHIIKAEVPAGFFSHIIVDEAGQCPEGDLFLPLGGLATVETSVVLCGDPKQLGPVITLDLTNELKKKFTAPLFRYMEDEKYQIDKRLCCQLVDCFRCHRSLVAIASVLFYDKKLLPTGPKDVDFDCEGLEMKADYPILFVSAKGTEQSEPKGKSYCNLTEAEICLEYADFFIREKEVPPEEIGIISPYVYQTKKIVEMMDKYKNARKLKQITVSSVERFQGSERKVIIMTATRTKQLGFMAENQRINTSVTRTKKVLIVIGDQNLLETHQEWRQFIMYCKLQKAVKIWNPKR